MRCAGENRGPISSSLRWTAVSPLSDPGDPPRKPHTSGTATPRYAYSDLNSSRIASYKDIRRIAVTQVRCRIVSFANRGQSTYYMHASLRVSHPLNPSSPSRRRPAYAPHTPCESYINRSESTSSHPSPYIILNSLVQPTQSTIQIAPMNARPETAITSLKGTLSPCINGEAPAVDC